MNANDTNAIDNTIDRALSTLRDAQPRSGLNGRILASLEHRTDELGGPSFHEVKGWDIVRGSERENTRRAIALWTATAAAIIAVASMMILHHHTTRTELARTPQSSAGSAANPGLAAGFSPLNTHVAKGGALAPAGVSSQSLQPSIEPTHRMAHRSAMPLPCAQSECPIHDGDTPAIMNGVSTTPTDAQMLADLHAPSHPAPPLPLTPQEKLLMRMSRYANATELAELDPMVRAKHDADETAAFKAFFPDPPPLQQPTGDTE